MGRSRYKIYEEDYPYFLTSSVVNWEPVFRRDSISNIILDSFEFLQSRREVTLYAYVIMEDHIHFIASGNDLAEKIRLFKSYTARKVIDYLKGQKEDEVLQKFRKNTTYNVGKSEFQLWQKGFHPKQIIGDTMMVQKIDYIHKNPVEAGYINEEEDWSYSSIHNYLDQKAPITITCYRR
ncbi:MAG: transposase [Balneolaceae bacterium]|nr:transposase [Balneolaceae bacterium]